MRFDHYKDEAARKEEEERQKRIQVGAAPSKPILTQDQQNALLQLRLSRGSDHTNKVAHS